MTTEWLAPQPMLQFTDASGNFLAGGKLFTYAAGTTTKLATYVDNTGSTPNANPVILNPNGTASIWIPPGVGYKFVLAPANDTDPPSAPIWTADQIFIAPVLPTPYSGNELYFARVNSAGSAYEVVSPAAVLAAIGAAPASGSLNYAPISAYGGIINSNTSLNLSANNTTYEVGPGSSAPFTITLPTPNANIRFRTIGGGGSYVASITTAAGSLITPDGTSQTLPYAASAHLAGTTMEFFADGTNWYVTNFTGQPLVRAATLPNQAPNWSQLFGGPSAANVAAQWNDVSGSRALGTTYTNSQNKPIFVMVSGVTGTVANNFFATVAGLRLPQSTTAPSNTVMGIAFFVPAGATYSVVADAGNPGVTGWAEFY